MMLLISVSGASNNRKGDKIAGVFVSLLLTHLFPAAYVRAESDATICRRDPPSWDRMHTLSNSGHRRQGDT